MKSKIILSLLTASLGTTLVSCDKPAAGNGAAPATSAAPAVPAVDPKAAFASALNGLGAEVAALEAKHKDAGNPVAMMKEMPALVAKLRNVPTEGLPEDLKTAFEKVRAASDKMVELLAAFPADMPAEEAAMGAYLQSHPEALKAIMEAGPKMQAVAAENEVAKEELKAAAARHNLDLNRFIEAGKPASAPGETPPAAEEAPAPAAAEEAPPAPAEPAPAGE